MTADKTTRLAALLQDLASDPEREAARILEAAGDLLRRSESLGLSAAQRTDLERALGAIRREAAAAAARVDVEAERARLDRAIDGAVEVALAEDETEARRAARPCLDALTARDRLAARAEGLLRWQELGAPNSLTRGPVSRDALRESSPPSPTDRPDLAFTDALRTIDRGLSHRARSLVGLNAARRAEAGSIDPSRRAEAWWYSARSACDGILSALADHEGAAAAAERAHLASCPDCIADLAVAASARKPPPRHLTTDELWRYDLGPMTDEERRHLDRHAKGCPSCAQAIFAYRDGERAVEEVADPVKPERPTGQRDR